MKRSRHIIPQVVALILGIAVILAAFNIYYVQELLAALALFTVLFGCLSAAFLLISLMERGASTCIGFAHTHARQILHRSHWRPPAGKLKSNGVTP